jgi:regulator of protease activity HflC (stomatin/prohibitin superfamily)
MLKTIISENERGFLYKNGRFVRMLEPGAHFAPSFLGCEVDIKEVGDKPFIDATELALYGRDKNFSDSVARVEVADGQIAIHLVDGRFKETLQRGLYAFWKIFREHSFIVINLSDDDPASVIPDKIMKGVGESECKTSIVKDHERGFLYRDGRFLRMIGPGLHSIPAFLGYYCSIETVGDKPIEFLEAASVELSGAGVVDFEIYMRDENFAVSVERVEIADGQRAIHLVDGRFKETLQRGTYAFWKVFHEHSFIVINLSDDDPAAVIPDEIMKNVGEPKSKTSIIKEHERGFLYRNGHFLRMIGPGSHAIPAFLGYYCLVEQVGDKPIEFVNTVGSVDFEIYMRDENFAESVERVEVPERHIALHYIDGIFYDMLQKGIHTFWTIFKRHEFKIIDMSDDSTLENIPVNILETMPENIRKNIGVEEWETALLYIDGAFVRRLPAGSHYFWNNGRKIHCAKYDMRMTQLDISGQEILTADKVALRVNFVCSYRITDPYGMCVKLKDYSAQIYAAAQLALREYLGGLRFDEVLGVKDQIAGRVLEILKRNEGELFVEFVSAGMKDIILPGEIRDIMNSVLVAEKKAEANVITRREEVASTRSLLNTARMMEENTTLFKLKELEYLERICDKVETINVGGAAGLLEQLRAMVKA